MTFYQELQLNQAGSKKLISESNSTKEKCYHEGVFLFKIILTVAFCFLFVTAVSMIFGNENSVVGVAILLALLAFRKVNLGYDVKQSSYVGFAHKAKISTSDVNIHLHSELVTEGFVPVDD